MKQPQAVEIELIFSLKEIVGAFVAGYLLGIVALF